MYNRTQCILAAVATCLLASSAAFAFTITSQSTDHAVSLGANVTNLVSATMVVL